MQDFLVGITMGGIAGLAITALVAWLWMQQRYTRAKQTQQNLQATIQQLQHKLQQQLPPPAAPPVAPPTAPPLEQLASQVNQLHGQLAESQQHITELQQELNSLAQSKIASEDRLHNVTQQNNLLLQKLSEFANLATSAPAGRRKEEDPDEIFDQLNLLSEENEVLRQKLEGLSQKNDLPTRLAEVIENLSDTKLVLESAMTEFGGLQIQMETTQNHLEASLRSEEAYKRIRLLRSEPDEQPVSSKLAELERSRRLLEGKLSKVRQQLNDVQNRYRLAMKRLHEIANVEQENQTLYLQLKVSNTKLAILKEKLAQIARKPDDLQKIRGLTADHKASLRKAGVDTFADLAVLTADHLRRILKPAEDTTPLYERWVQEAKRYARQSVYIDSWLLSRPGRPNKKEFNLDNPLIQELNERLTAAILENARPNSPDRP